MVSLLKKYLWLFALVAPAAAQVLQVPNGGTGTSAIAANQVWVGSGTNATAVYTLPDCPGPNQALTWSAATPGFACETVASSSGVTYTSPTVNAVPKVATATAPGNMTDSAYSDDGTTATIALPTHIADTSHPSLIYFTPTAYAPATQTGSTGFGAPATVTTPSLMTGPSAPFSGIAVWTNTSGVMTPAQATIGSGLSLSGGTLSTTGSSSPIANIQITVGTSAIAANTCVLQTAQTMTGVATTSTFHFTPSSDVSSVTGWGAGASGQLYFSPWPTANTLNFKVCNPTSSSITPGASTTWNVSAL